MVNRVINILEQFLGQGSPRNKNNYAFHCPFCKHHKPKLEIQLESEHWHCWVCGSKGKTFKALAYRVKAPDHVLVSLKKLSPTKSYEFPNELSNENVKSVPSCKLPKEYRPLWELDTKNLLWNNCIEYLEQRGIQFSDILKYRLGYCMTGHYSNMIVFPNFNKQGELNFFTTRSYSNSNSVKFINPSISKNIVGFEMQLSWDIPLILVESALDAIVIKRNASPLYGTVLSKELRKNMLLNDVKSVYIALDSDALSKSITHAELLMGTGMNVHFVELPTGADPNSIGYDGMWELIDSTPPLTEFDLFKYKVSNKIYG